MLFKYDLVHQDEERRRIEKENKDKVKKNKEEELEELEENK